MLGRLNQKGMSLGELMVASAIGLILMLFFFDSTTMTLKMFKGFQQSSDFRDLKGQIGNLIERPDQCRCNFGYKAGGPRAVMRIPIAPPENFTVPLPDLKFFSDRENCNEGSGDVVMVADRGPRSKLGAVTISNIYLGRFQNLSGGVNYRAILYVTGETKDAMAPGGKRNVYSSYSLLLKAVPVNSAEVELVRCYDKRKDI